MGHFPPNSLIQILIIFFVYINLFYKLFIYFFFFFYCNLVSLSVKYFALLDHINYNIMMHALVYIDVQFKDNLSDMKSITLVKDSKKTACMNIVLEMHTVHLSLKLDT